MTISNRIEQVVNLNKNVTMIETNPTAYRKIKQDTLDYLESKHITIEVHNGAKDLSFYTYKTDCFAYNNKQCKALTDINCANCKFYRKDITQSRIETEVRNYLKRGGTNE